jgi:hypothetical protein
MQAHDEFWLKLHDLASDLDSDNVPIRDKAKQLAGYLTLYPPMARQQIVDDFRFVLAVLSELEATVASGKDATADPKPRLSAG